MRALSLLVLLALVSVAVAQPVRQDRVDEASVETAARALRDTLARAVREAGGDIERQHVHLILAFSTGHFNKDPMRAQAARLLAWYLIRDTLVEGDQLSCYAWELSLWDHRRGQPRTVTVEASARNDPAKQKLQDMFPTTVQDGSVGGHDTERAILEIVREVGNASDAVMVLITNDAQSVAPKGYQTIGTDNPEYQQVLNWWRRLPQVSQSGASQRITFTIVQANGGRSERNLDIVTVVPLRFSGDPLSQPRSTLLQKQTPAAVRREPRSPFRVPPYLWIALVVPVALVLGAAIRKKVGKGIPQSLRFRVGHDVMEFGSALDGDELCVLVGERYKPTTEDESKRLIRVVDGLAHRIAMLRRHGRNLEVVPEEADLKSINDIPRTGDKEPALIPAGQNSRLEFMVQVPQIGPPLRKRFAVEIQWDSHTGKEDGSK